MISHIRQPYCGKPIVVCNACFLYICFMRALVVTTRNDREFKFLADLLKKLGISSSSLTPDELEDLALSKLLRRVDKTKKASRAEIMKKLSA